MAEPVLVCWSGGKDSALALQAVLADPALRVAALVTTVTEGPQRVSLHGVCWDLVRRQADALGLPIEAVRIRPDAAEDEYEGLMRRVLSRYKEAGVARCVFGDVFLAEARDRRERNLAKVGMRGLYPIWGRPSQALARAFCESGFRAILVCVDSKQLAPSFGGREFDAALLADLPPGVDPCGENGEFHTFVYDGPIFRRPVPVVRGETVERKGFWFFDLTAKE